MYTSVLGQDIMNCVDEVGTTLEIWEFALRYGFDRLEEDCRSQLMPEIANVISNPNKGIKYLLDRGTPLVKLNLVLAKVMHAAVTDTHCTRCYRRFGFQHYRHDEFRPGEV
jgi:hypothetical protein